MDSNVRTVRPNKIKIRSAYNPLAQVDDQGNLLYVFPDLQRTGGAAKVILCCF